MRRLLTHIGGLPADSAYLRTLRGERANWSQEAEIQASIVDALHLLTHYYLGAHTETPPEPPTRFPRPGEDEDLHEPETVPLASLAQILQE